MTADIAVPKRRPKPTSSSPINNSAQISETTDPLPLFSPNSRREIEALKKQHSLPDNFNLLHKLRSIYRQLQGQLSMQIEMSDPVHQSLRAPSALQRKQFLTRVRTRARKLHECLIDADEAELSLLIYGAASTARPASNSERPSLLFPHGNLVQITKLLAQLDHAARSAGKKSSKRGRKGQESLVLFVTRLRELYVQALGEKAPRITRGETYSGRFFAFVNDAWTLFGMKRIGNRALGRLCEIAIKEVDKASSIENRAD